MAIVNGVETGTAAAAPAPGSPEAIAATAAAEKVTTDKAAADKVTADKVAADKATADAAAKAKEDAKPGNLMDDAAKEAKAVTDAENKRLLDAKEEDLSEPDKLKKAELIKANAEAEKAKGAPEKYEFKAPEGFTLDMEKVENTFIPFAKKHNFTQEVAQDLVTMYAGIVTQSNEAQAENFKTFVEGLKTETVKELGTNYKERLSFAAKSRDRFASPELVEKLNQSGLSNDKDMIKLFIKLGEAIAEDKVPEGPAGAGGKKTPEEVLFPSAAKK